MLKFYIILKFYIENFTSQKYLVVFMWWLFLLRRVLGQP